MLGVPLFFWSKVITANKIVILEMYLMRRKQNKIYAYYWDQVTLVFQKLLKTYDEVETLTWNLYLRSFQKSKYMG